MKNTQNKETKKLAKHRANLDKMKYEAYVNFSRSYNLKPMVV